MRLRECAVFTCHCSGIWCSAWAVVSCCVTVAWFFCGWGAALGAARETQRLPALRGSSQRAVAPATLFRPPGRPYRKESQTFGLIPFRILWIATAVGCQATHASLLPFYESPNGDSTSKWFGQRLAPLSGSRLFASIGRPWPHSLQMVRPRPEKNRWSDESIK